MPSDFRISTSLLEYERCAKGASSRKDSVELPKLHLTRPFQEKK